MLNKIRNSITYKYSFWASIISISVFVLLFLLTLIFPDVIYSKKAQDELMPIVVWIVGLLSLGCAGIVLIPLIIVDSVRWNKITPVKSANIIKDFFAFSYSIGCLALILLSWFK